MTLPYPTLAEAAEALQFKSERAFRDWLRAHPQDARGEPYVRAAGQGRVMTWDDVERVRTAVLVQAMDRVRSGGPKDRPGSVYFIEAGDFIKIGFSRSILARVVKMLTDSPFELKLLHDEPGTFKTEKILHRQFAALRVRGEWFRKTDELLAYIEQRKTIPPAAESAP